MAIPDYMALYGRPVHGRAPSDARLVGLRYPVSVALPCLHDFLADPTRPAGTLAYHELQGFLFAVACSPEMLEPSEWMAAIFNDADPRYADLEEAQHVLDQFRALYNDMNTAVLAGTPSLPADCDVSADLLANFDHEAPLASWSRGFVEGHDWLRKLPQSVDSLKVDCSAIRSGHAEVEVQ